MKVVLRAMALLPEASRRRYQLVAPLAILVAAVELVGFVLLAAVVQVLAEPELLDGGGIVGRLATWFDIDDSGRFVVVVGIAAAVTLTIRGVAATAILYWQSGVLASSEADLASRLFTSYMRADYRYHLTRHSADLVRTIQYSVRNATQRVLVPGVVVVTEIAIATGIGVTLLVLQPVPALVSVATLSVVALIYVVLVRPRARRYGERDEGLSVEDNRVLQEGLYANKTLMVLGRRETVAARYEQLRSERKRTLRKIIFLQQFARYYIEFALIVLLVVIVAASMIQGGGEATLSSLGVLLVGSLRLLPSVQRSLNALSVIHAGGGSVSVLEAELGAALDQVEASDGLESANVSPLPFEHELGLEELSFGYDPSGPLVLRGVSVSLPRGQSLGIVGASGSGKSTLVDLLAGLLEPTGGRLTVDGHVVTNQEMARWRQLLGYVPQETMIVDDSLARNVALGIDPSSIDEARVREVISLAQLDTVLAGLPAGIDTPLGDRGVRLSGGQRQRVGIARALYHGPKVLIFDEATSALDGPTERQVTETIESLYGQVTAVVVAHRLSTVRGCDRIVVLAEGAVAAIGTPDELAASSAEFAAFLDAEQTGAGPRPTVDGVGGRP